jgi:restriction system protein
MMPIILFGVVIVLLTVACAIVKTSWFKGRTGEFIINLAIKLFLNKDTYHLVRDVTLPAGDGTTQIDHVIVSRYGIFVIETKNMAGAIDGTEHDKQWTQAFGPRTHKFMNPLHQNYKHTHVLAELLDLPHEKMISIVMFIGDAKLKTKDKPINVMDHGLCSFIKSHRAELLRAEQVEKALTDIETKRLTRGFQTNRKHVAHVKNIKDRNVFLDK